MNEWNFKYLNPVDDGTIMAIRQEEYPIEGVQFHPETIGMKHLAGLF